MTTIEFEGLTFDDAASRGYTISRLAGWWDGAIPKGELEDRGQQSDGYFQVDRSRRAGRVVTVEGEYIGDTMEDTAAAIRTIRALQAKGKASPFRVVEQFSDLRSTMLLTKAPLLPDQIWQPRFGFKFDVTSYDPQLYGPQQVLTAGIPSSGGGLVLPFGTTPTAYWDFGADGSSGRVSFTNDGTGESWGTLSASGGLGGGFVATDVSTGQVVRFERPIPVGSTVYVNQRTGRAWIDAPTNDVSGYLTGRDFFMVGAGETHQIQFAPLGVVTGAPQFAFAASPAYL